MAILKVRLDQNKALCVSSETRAVAFKDWGMKESDVENFVVGNISQIMGEETGLLLVGEHVTDENGKQNDLVALDGNGCLVLIEIKRDKADMEARKEELEFQAVRYCASLATISTIDELVRKMYAKYLKKREPEYKGDRSYEELAKAKIEDFLKDSGSLDDFNEKQRIVLISSGYDDSTKSACAWLIKQGVDITLVELQPLEIGGDKQINIEQIMPPENLEDAFVPFKENGQDARTSQKGNRQRTNLPRMSALFEWGIIKVGDMMYIKGHRDAGLAKVVDQNTVDFEGTRMSFNEWGNKVTGWTSIAIYDFATIDGQKDPRTLGQMRSDYMIAHKKEN